MLSGGVTDTLFLPFADLIHPLSLSPLNEVSSDSPHSSGILAQGLALNLMGGESQTEMTR